MDKYVCMKAFMQIVGLEQHNLRLQRKHKKLDAFLGSPLKAMQTLSRSEVYDIVVLTSTVPGRKDPRSSWKMEGKIILKR